MAAYRVEIAPRALRQLRKLERRLQVRIASKIDSLAADPRPAGCVKLSDSDDLFRVRVGEYRIVYQMRDRLLLVLVLNIGHRRDVYR